MLTIRCKCGEQFHAEERHIGHAIKCPSCGHILQIESTPPTPSSYRSVESSTSTRPPTFTTGRSWFSHWAIFGLALTVIVTAGAVLLAIRKYGQQESLKQPVVATMPAEIASRSDPDPLPSPPTPKQLPINRLITGTNIRPPQRASGRGSLQINNGTSYDAAVRLRDENTGIVRFVYVRTGESTTLSAIAPCQCQLFFEVGADWIGLAEHFRQDSNFSVFDDLLPFNESKTEDRVQWAKISVTLHPVPGGKARTTRLSKEEFERRVGNPDSRKVSN